MKKLVLRKLGNHWYPDVKHVSGGMCGFSDKIDRYLSVLDNFNIGMLTVDFFDLGVTIGGRNVIYFNEADIVRYLTTEDTFDLRFVVNKHCFCISSNLYALLEKQLNFNFHKESYEIYIY